MGKINGLFNNINKNYNTMAITIPEDKKKILTKEIKAVEEKLEVLGRFKSTVQVIVDLVNNLTAFDNSIKAIDTWKDAATAELKDIKEASGSMLPEDRVARTMDLQEDIAAKLEILKTCAATEQELLPQGDKVPADAQVFKDELTRIIKCLRSSSPTPRLSVTNTQMMSNSGLSTELESRNSHLGWLQLRRQQLRVSQSHLTSVRCKPSMTRFSPLTRPVRTTSRFSRLLREPPSR